MAQREKPSEIVFRDAFSGQRDAEELIWAWVLRTVIRLVKTCYGPRMGITHVADQEDIIQESLESMLKMPKGRLQQSIESEAFLATVVHRRTVELIRRRVRRDGERSISTPIGEDIELIDLLASPLLTEHTVELAEIYAFIDSLGKENSRILRLYIDGYKIREIAVDTKLPETTITSRLYRLLKLLRDRFS